MKQEEVNIEVVSIDDLIQDDHNFNKGNEQGAQLLERSFRECGAGRSVLIDKDNRLVGGNKAQKGFKAAGKKKVIIVDSDADTLVAVRRKDVSLDSAEGRKMAYLDNLTTQVNLTWDQTELEAVQADVEGFDIADFGFDIEDLPQVTFPTGEKQGEGDGKPQTEVKEDDFDPDAHYETKVKAGEVWQLGEHRLMCGDSTDTDAVAKLMNGERADMCFTDPPYGVSYTGGIQFKSDGSVEQNNRQMIANDDIDIYAKVLEVLKDVVNGPCYIWFADKNAASLYAAAEKYGEIHAQIIWVKNGGYGALNANYKQKHEPCLYWKPKGATLNFIGATTETTIWEINKDGKNEYHPTQKPVALSGKAISNHKADIILDLFGGSGSTMIACEQLGRKCRMMELDPHYCTVIIARWEKLTGGKAQKIEGV